MSRYEDSENSGESVDVNILALAKFEERYIFLFTAEYRAEALRTLGRFASNPELSFTWYDAAVLSQRIRQGAEEEECEERERAILKDRFILPPPENTPEP